MWRLENAASGQLLWRNSKLEARSRRNSQAILCRAIFSAMRLSLNHQNSHLPHVHKAQLLYDVHVAMQAG
eukprot:2542417-Pleurochrysis_carterae.AAC.1